MVMIECSSTIYKHSEEIGFEPKNVVRFTYKVKEDFTTKPIFKTGKLFINERREKDRSEVREMDSKAFSIRQQLI